MNGLKRSLSLPMITFYGLGTIIGGGFYALAGKVSAEAGMFTPIAFAVAAVVAGFSAFSYAELSARFPLSAGEAHYVQAAFRKTWPAALIGWAVIATGLVSAATLAAAVGGFARDLVGAPETLVACSTVIGLGLVAAWGIGQSAAFAVVITVIEIACLLVVAGAASDNIASIPERWTELTPSLDTATWSGILAGSFLAFYSFVGFEDMVNVAEEVKNPRRNLPIAIFAAVGVTGLIYFGVSMLVVLDVDPEKLAASGAPLALVFAKGSAAAIGVTAVAMFSGVNGALVQIVMASRVAYGMANNREAPRIFGVVNPKTQTPVYATAAATAAVLLLALRFNIVALATITSTILLMIYSTVNISLVVIRQTQEESPDYDGPRYPILMPILGAAACLGFLLLNAVAFYLNS